MNIVNYQVFFPNDCAAKIKLLHVFDALKHIEDCFLFFVSRPSNDIFWCKKQTCNYYRLRCVIQFCNIALFKVAQKLKIDAVGMHKFKKLHWMFFDLPKLTQKFKLVQNIQKNLLIFEELRANIVNKMILESIIFICILLLND